MFLQMTFLNQWKKLCPTKIWCIHIHVYVVGMRNVVQEQHLVCTALFRYFGKASTDKQLPDRQGVQTRDLLMCAISYADTKKHFPDVQHYSTLSWVSCLYKITRHKGTKHLRVHA